MMHSMSVEWPCLSFAIVPDALGPERRKFPHSMYLVSGSQSADASQNRLYVMKATSLTKTKYDADSESPSDQSDDEPLSRSLKSKDLRQTKNATLHYAAIEHPGVVNRVRFSEPDLCATWSENGAVYVWKISEELQHLSSEHPSVSKKKSPVNRYQGHGGEGYALEWSALVPGRLISGACNGTLLAWQVTGGGCDPLIRFGSGDSSVEDIQGSPEEAQIFASCSTDGSIRIWDCRQPLRPVAEKAVHPGTDVNVISWSKTVPFLLATGSDDGRFATWDLRSLSQPDPLAAFGWHRDAITSLEWHPSDPSVIAVSGADDQVTFWDLSLEADEESSEEGGAVKIPPQLLFIHQGQTSVKEIHWHPQIPGAVVSTASDGFNFFKPANII